MNSWLIPLRSDVYDLERAFSELKDNCIDQHQANNGFEIGDIVYIYCPPERAIKYKCLIKEINIPFNKTIDDSQFFLNGTFLNRKTYKNYMRLQLFEKINIGLKILQKYGINGLHLQQKIENGLLEYLNDITSDTTIDQDIDEDETAHISKTEKIQLSSARIGQGLFRQKVIAIDKKCIITGVDDTSLLIASHIKAWSESELCEKLDGNNGILLSPHLDKLFDKYLISFTDGGKILCNNNIKDILVKWNIDISKEYCQFSKERIKYLEYHRKKYNENI